ncbi:TonB-dependent receptor plug domain-containing protein [Sphingomonas sp. MMS24-JH45]
MTSPRSASIEPMRGGRGVLDRAAFIAKGHDTSSHERSFASPCSSRSPRWRCAFARRDCRPAREEASDDIVVLGTRQGRADRTLSSDIVTERMSQSSRSIERDLLTAGTYRLSDALELVSGVSNQNNRGGFLDNFAIRGFLGTPDGGAEYYVDGFPRQSRHGAAARPRHGRADRVAEGAVGALVGRHRPRRARQHRQQDAAPPPQRSPTARSTRAAGGDRRHRSADPHDRGEDSDGGATA